jgi:hypothetical protein
MHDHTLRILLKNNARAGFWLGAFPTLVAMLAVTGTSFPSMLLILISAIVVLLITRAFNARQGTHGLLRNLDQSPGSTWLHSQLPDRTLLVFFVVGAATGLGAYCLAVASGRLLGELRRSFPAISVYTLDAVAIAIVLTAIIALGLRFGIARWSERKVAAWRRTQISRTQVEL